MPSSHPPSVFLSSPSTTGSQSALSTTGERKANDVKRTSRSCTNTPNATRRLGGDFCRIMPLCDDTDSDELLHEDPTGWDLCCEATGRMNADPIGSGAS